MRYQVRKYIEHRRLIGTPTLLVWIGSALGIAVVHGGDIARNWSQLHWEDPLFFQHDAAFIHSLKDCFVQASLWPGLYRPLTTNCYYYLGDLLFQNHIEVYHAINVLLYAFNGILLYWIATHFIGRGWALCSALLFVTRAAHVEVVTNTVEFQVLLSLFFSLLALKFFLLASERNQNAYVPLFCLLFALALLSKESAAVLPLIMLTYGWIFTGFRRPHLYLGPVLVVLGWVVLFDSVFRGISGYQPTGFIYTRSAEVVLRNYAAYLWSFPNWLTWHAESVVMPQAVVQLADSRLGQSAPVLIAGTMLTLVGLKHRLNETWRTLCFGCVLFLVGTAPFVFFEDRLFMRYAYFGHAGLALGASALLMAVKQAVQDLYSRQWRVQRAET